MKILVTGGAGFIGSQIADAYINAGHQVAILDNLSTGRVENINKNAEFIKADIQSEELADIFKQHKFDIVNHQAAQMDVRRSVEDPIYDAKNNVLGFINVLQNSAVNGVKKVIFASSGGAVYGEQDYFPADEEHKLQPYSPYGITKLVGEKYLFYYANTWGINYTALRYANVYGPRQNPNGEAGVIAIFIQKMLTGEEPVINGNGEQTRDFVNVKDVVKASVLALNDKENNIYNVGTSIESTINDVFRILNEATGANIAEQHAPGKEGEQFRSVVSYKKIEKMLGWKPDIQLRDGLIETVEYFREHEL